MSGIVIHRSRHAQEFVVIPNAVARDKTLSFRARGLLVMLLSLPPDWHVTTTMLAEDNPEGRDPIRRALAELCEAGYIVMHREQGERGRWRTWMEVFDVPQDAATEDDPSRPRSDLGETHVSPGRTEDDPSRPRSDLGKRASSQVAPKTGRVVPKRKTGTKNGTEKRGYSRAASSRAASDQTRSAANSPKPRVHHGPKQDGSDAQHIPGEVLPGGPATDRNAREVMAGPENLSEEEEESAAVFTITSTAADPWLLGREHDDPWSAWPAGTIGAWENRFEPWQQQAEDITGTYSETKASA